MMKTKWKWTAIGKHPLAMDYFQFGPNEALTNAFAGWIENGYHRLISTNQRGTTFHSWRFWVPGKRKGTVACGIGRDSSDRMGRPYPFLMIGMGTMTGWEEHWDLLPIVFEDTWNRMEQLASAQLTDLKELEYEINRMKGPTMDRAVPANRPWNRDIPSLSDTIKKSTEGLLRDHEFYAPINDNHDHDAFSLVMHWHRGLKSHLKMIPGIVLMGGTPEKSYMAAFNRSLNANDFVKLWTIP
jgi:type VI secretion system ImpM family protein